MAGMAGRNIDVVRAGYEAWNRGDLDAVREIYAPDVTASAGALWPAAGEVSGADAIIQAFASIFSAFERSELVAEEYIEHGESVVVPTLWRGTLAGSEGTIEQRLVAVYTLRDGRVVHIGYHGGMAEALGSIEVARS
ncbi:MAG: SnoaL-like domain [Thermoleophilaceae bacterium]|nr:SnoaL-like domain [Thermoleophilaceae bacterium]